jgi:EpsI family protein
MSLRALETKKTTPYSFGGAPNRFPWWRSALVLALVLIVVVTIFLGGGINRSSEAGVVMDLPDTVGAYLGFNQDVTAAEKRILPPDTEFAKKRYIGGPGGEVSCEIVLSGSQKKSIHRPQVCLVGQGWTILQEQPVIIPLPDGRKQRVRVLTLSREMGARTATGYFVYWFVGRDKTTDDHLKRILYTSWDRLAHGVNHRWAYIIVSGIIPGELDPRAPAAQRTLEQLLDFARDVIPAVEKPNVVPQG